MYSYKWLTPDLFLGRNPTTGEQLNGVSDKCEFKAAKTQACCVDPDLRDDCPEAKEK